MVSAAPGAAPGSAGAGAGRWQASPGAARSGGGGGRVRREQGKARQRVGYPSISPNAGFLEGLWWLCLISVAQTVSTDRLKASEQRV